MKHSVVDLAELEDPWVYLEKSDPAAELQVVTSCADQHALVAGDGQHQAQYPGQPDHWNN